MTGEQEVAANAVRAAAAVLNRAVGLACDVGLSVQLAVSETGKGHEAAQRVHPVIEELTAEP